MLSFKKENRHFLIERISQIQNMTIGNKRLIIILGLLGDFDSLEYIQALKDSMPVLESSNIKLTIIGIGNESSRNKFSKFIGITTEFIELEKDRSLHTKLGLARGSNFRIGGLSNLLLMCAGIASPGTIKEVIRGYIGDRNSNQIYKDDQQVCNALIPKLKGRMFSYFWGKGFLRPFEMATLRLGNMIEVMRNWNTYMINHAYLPQRGGTFLLDENNKLLYYFLPQGLLGYSATMSQPIHFLRKYLNNI